MQGFLLAVGFSAFLLCISAGFFVSYSWVLVLWFACLSVLLTFAARALQISTAIVFVIGAFCVIGAARMVVLEPVYTPALDVLVGQRVQLQGVVVDEVDERESSARVTVRADEIVVDDVHRETDGQVLVLVAPHPVVQYGDRISVSGVLKKPEAFETDTGRIFNYPAYLSVSGTGYTLNFAHLDSVEIGAPSIKRTLFWLKEWYLGKLQTALSEPQAALAGGITVGDKRALGGELLDIFRDSGIVHIVVLSGYNITVIIAFLLSLMASLSRPIRLVVGVIIIVLFVLMTGATATGVRAGIMASIGLLALVTYRHYDAGRALMFATFLMVLYNPRVLLFDPGFQLSVVATLGLLYIAPVLAARLSKVPTAFGLREIVATTLGTQIAVLPLLIFIIGEISLVSILTNVLVLPIVPLAMLLSFVAALGASFSTLVGVALGFPAYLLLTWIIEVARVVGMVPLGVVEISLKYALLVLVSCLLLGAWFVVRKRQANQ